MDCRLAIACYLVFEGCHGDPAAVTALVRCKRPGALQTRQQERFVNVFACYLQHLRCVPGAKSLLDSSMIVIMRQQLALMMYLGPESPHAVTYWRWALVQ